MLLTREHLVEGLPLGMNAQFEALTKVPESEMLELTLDYAGNIVSLPVKSDWELRLTVNREYLLESIIGIKAEVSSLTVGDSLMWVSGDEGGVSVHVPLTFSAAAKLLLSKKQLASAPGEEMPAYQPRSTSRSTKMGPPVGTERSVNGVLKRLVRYDFITPKLKGRRRVTCPDTHKKGFPVWERI